MDRKVVRALVAGVVAVSLTVTGVVAVLSASADTAPRRIVNGWLPYWTTAASLASATANADLWGDASPFWYQATGATTITERTGAGDSDVVDALHDGGITVLPSVTESLNAAAMAPLLADPAQRAAHVTTLVKLVTDHGYDGLDLDYEAMNAGGTPADKTAVRTGFVALANELAAALRAKKKLLSITVGPRTKADDPNWAVFDYAGLATAADRFRIMTYDKHWRNGSAGAVAPLPWVVSVITYATTAVTPSKIEIGVPLYGYDWPADTTQSDKYGTAATVNYQQAEALRSQYRATRQYSTADAAPYFEYTAADGIKHTVWYNDVYSTKAKMYLVGKYGLRGLAFWAVGSEDTRQWNSLRSYAIQRTARLTVGAPAKVTYGAEATVTGRLTSASGTAIVGQRIALQWQRAGATTWTTVAYGKTSSTGWVALKHKPAANGAYRLHAYPSWTYVWTNSAAAKTQVRWKVSAKVADRTVRRGAHIQLTGKVSPARAGTTVQRQRYVGGKWTVLSSTTVRADGTYTFSFVWKAPATYIVRVAAPGAGRYATGASSQIKIVVS